MNDTTSTKNNRDPAYSRVISTPTQDFPTTAMFPWSRWWKARSPTASKHWRSPITMIRVIRIRNFRSSWILAVIFRHVQAAQTKYRDKIEILAGMEIGILKGHFEEARRAVDSYPFDVIIGSFHCTRNDDMYRYDFAHADGPAELEDFYTYMYECLRSFRISISPVTSAFWIVTSGRSTIIAL